MHLATHLVNLRGSRRSAQLLFNRSQLDGDVIEYLNQELRSTDTCDCGRGGRGLLPFGAAAVVVFDADGCQ